MPALLRSIALLCGLTLAAGESIPAQIEVDAAKPGLTIPADFLGISYEKNALVEPHFKPGNSVLINLHRNLGSGTLRLGGNKVELTRWQADAAASLDKATGLAVIGRTTLDDLYGFIKATEWKCLHGINLAGNQPESSADEAAYALKVGAASILAIEVGNEPNLYTNHDLRKQGYDCPTYLPEAVAAIKVIRARNPGIILAGPATARRPDHWFEDAVAGLKGRLRIATSHTYALSGGSTKPTSANFPSIENLLLPATMAKDVAMVDEHLAAAKAAGMRYRLAECNSVSNGGRTGVSDTFVSALWATDFLFSIAERGADGINFHCNLKPGSYSPVSWSKTESRYDAHPLYYAMLAFKEAGRGRVLPTHVKCAANVTAHATLGADGKVRILLTNKDLSRSVVANLATGRTQGSVVRLLAPSADAKTGITFAGAAADAAGKWTAKASEPMGGSGNAVTLALPAGSAAVVTLD
jgi:hypothetical protein